METNKDIRDSMFDFQIGISNMVYNAWKKKCDMIEEKKNQASHLASLKDYDIVQIPQSIQERVTLFQKLLNIIFERSIRDVYERSFNSFIYWLSNSLNIIEAALGKCDNQITDNYLLKLHDDPLIKSKLTNQCIITIYLKVSDTPFAAQYNPTLLVMKEQLIGIPNYIIEKIKEIPCFSCKDIGFARENGKTLVINEDDKYTETSLLKLGHLLDTHFILLRSFLNLLAPITEIFNLKISSDLHCDCSNEDSINTAEEELQIIKKIETRFKRLIPHSVMQFGLFYVDCSEFKQQITEQILQIRNLIYKRVTDEMIGAYNEVKAKVDEAIFICNGKPDNIEDLDKIQKYKNNLSEVITNIKKINKITMKKYDIALSNNYTIPQEQFLLIMQSYSLPLQIEGASTVALKTIEANKGLFKDQLRKFISQIAEETAEIKNEFTNLQLEENIADYDKISKSFNILGEKLDKAIANSAIINMREGILAFTLTKFDDIKRIKRDFEPFNTLWTLAKDYYADSPFWQNSFLSEISKERVTKAVEEALSSLAKIIKSNLGGKEGPLTVAKQLFTLYKSFEPNLPLIKHIKNQYLQQRHWDEMAAITHISQLNSMLQVSLQTLLDNHIMDYKEKIAEISDYALKEQNIEATLKKMRDEWTKKSFQFMVEEEINIILIQYDPLIALAENQLITLSMIKFTPFAKNLIKEIEIWDSMVTRIQQLINDWVKFQKDWAEFAHIFLLEAIKNKLSKESKKFDLVDISWKHELQQVKASPSIIEVVNQSKLSEIISQGNEKMIEIRKSLKEFSAPAKLTFPILYKYDDFSILKILSPTESEFSSVINTIYPFIKSVAIREGKVNSATTSDGHEIMFEKAVLIANEKAEEKKIEELLKEINESLITNNRLCIINTANKISTLKDIGKVPHYYSPIIFHYFWCKDAIKQLDSGESVKKLLNNVAQILHLFNKEKDVSLILLSSYHRDCLELLGNANASNDKSFEWQAIFKYELLANEKTQDMYLTTFLYRKLLGYHSIDYNISIALNSLLIQDYRTLLFNSTNKFTTIIEGPNYTEAIYGSQQIVSNYSSICGVSQDNMVCTCETNIEQVKAFIYSAVYSGSILLIENVNMLSQNLYPIIWKMFYNLDVDLKKSNKNIIDIEGVSLTLRHSFNIICTNSNSKVQLPDNLRTLFRTLYLQNYDSKELLKEELELRGIENAKALSSGIVDCCVYIHNIYSNNSKPISYSIATILKIIKAKSISNKNDIANLIYRHFISILENKQNISDIIEKTIDATINYSDEEIAKAYEYASKVFNIIPTNEHKSCIQSLITSLKLKSTTIITGLPQSGKTTLVNMAYLMHLYMESQGPPDITNEQFIYGNPLIWDKQTQRIKEQLQQSIPYPTQLYTFFATELILTNLESHNWVHIDGNIKFVPQMKNGVAYEPANIADLSPVDFNTGVIYVCKAEGIKEVISKRISELPIYLHPTSECDKVLSDSLLFLYNKIVSKVFNSDVYSTKEVMHLYFKYFEIILLNKRSKALYYNDYLKQKNYEELRKQDSNLDIAKDTSIPASFRYYSRYINSILFTILWMMQAHNIPIDEVNKYQASIFDKLTELKEVIGNALIDIDSRYLPFATDSIANQLYDTETNLWQVVQPHAKMNWSPSPDLLYVYTKRDCFIMDAIEKMNCQGVHYIIKGKSKFNFTKILYSVVYALHIIPTSSLSTFESKLTKWALSKHGNITVLIDDINQELNKNQVEIIEYLRLITTKGINSNLEGQEAHISPDSILLSAEHVKAALGKLENRMVPVYCEPLSEDYYDLSFKSIITNKILNNQGLEEDLLLTYKVYRSTISKVLIDVPIIDLLEKYKFVLASILSGKIQHNYEYERDKLNMFKVAIYYCARELVGSCNDTNEIICHTLLENAKEILITKIDWDTYDISNYVCKEAAIIPIDTTLKNTMEKSIEAFCSSFKRKVDYILIKEAIQHIYSISNITTTYNLNSGLFGPQHYGKGALAQLSYFIDGYTIYNLEVSHRFTNDKWLEFLGRALRESIAEGKKIAIYINEASLYLSYVASDISVFATDGTLQSSFNEDDISEIIEHGRTFQKNFTIEKLWEQSKLNIKFIFSFHNQESIKYIQVNYPSILKNSHFEYFTEIPLSIYDSIAQIIMFPNSEENINVFDKSLMEVALFIYKTSFNASQKFNISLRPSHFTEFMKALKANVYIPRNKLEAQLKKIQEAVKQLEGCDSIRNELHKKIDESVPNLKNLKSQTELATEEVKKSNSEFEEKKAEIDKITEEEGKERNKNICISSECELKLKPEEAGLKEIKAALKNIDHSAWKELKEIQKMTYSSKAIIDIIGELFGVKPVYNQVGSKKEKSYLPGFVKLLKTSQSFINKVDNYDKDHVPISDAKTKSLNEYLSNTKLSIDQIKKASPILEIMNNWLKKIQHFDKVVKDITPTRKILQASNDKLAEYKANLTKLSKQLEDIAIKVKATEDQFKVLSTNKRNTEQEMVQSKNKMENSLKLSTQLTRTKNLWIKKVKTLEAAKESSIGDSIIAIGCVHLLTQFPESAREGLVKLWLDELYRNSISYSPKASKLYTDIVASQFIREVAYAKSTVINPTIIENIIMYENSQKWVFAIDPLSILINFIKAKEDPNDKQLDFMCVKYEDDYESVLKMCLKAGQTVFLEINNGVIDTKIEQLIRKTVFIDKSKKCYCIDNSYIEINDKFQLIAYTNRPSPIVTAEIASLFKVINFAPNNSIYQDIIMKELLLDFDSKGNQEKVSQNKSLLENKRSKTETLEHILNQFGLYFSTVLDDTTVLNSLLDSDNKYNDLKSKIRNTKATIKNAVVTIAYKNCALIITQFIVNILPLFPIAPDLLILLWKAALKNGELKKEPTPDGKANSLIKSMVGYIMSLIYCYLGYSHPELVIKCALFALEALKKLEIGSTYRLLTITQHHCADLKKEDLLKLLNDSETKYIDDICSKDSAKISQLPLFIQALTLKLTKPLDFSSLILRNIEPYITSYGYENQPYQIILTCCNSTIPIIVVSSPENSVIEEITQLATDENRFVKIHYYNQKEEESCLQVINEFKKISGWLIIIDAQSSHSLSNIKEILTSKSKTDEGFVHHEFRIWFVISDKNIAMVPTHCLQSSFKIYRKQVVNLKQSLKNKYARLQKFKKEKEAFEQSKNSSHWRKLFFTCNVLHSLITKRSQIGLMGCSPGTLIMSNNANKMLKYAFNWANLNTGIETNTLSEVIANEIYCSGISSQTERALIEKDVKRIICDNILCYKYEYCSNPAYYIPFSDKYDDFVNYVNDLPNDEDMLLLNYDDKLIQIYNHHQGMKIQNSLINYKGSDFLYSNADYSALDTMAVSDKIKDKMYNEESIVLEFIECINLMIKCKTTNISSVIWGNFTEGKRRSEFYRLYNCWNGGKDILPIELGNLIYPMKLIYSIMMHMEFKDKSKKFDLAFEAHSNKSNGLPMKMWLVNAKLTSDGYIEESSNVVNSVQVVITASKKDESPKGKKRKLSHIIEDTVDIPAYWGVFTMENRNQQWVEFPLKLKAKVKGYSDIIDSRHVILITNLDDSEM